MRTAPKTLLQVNTRVWLQELRAARNNRNLTLGGVDPAVVEGWKASGLDAAWLLGAWTSSTKAQEHARSLDWLRKQAREILGHPKPDDIVASPYAVPEYALNPSLGDLDDLEDFRERLHEHGLQLVLDFVPNHTALDHPWTREHPEYFIRGTSEDLKREPGNWFTVPSTDRKMVLAHGRDPHFDPWTDTAQINIFHKAARKAVIREMVRVASLCDGIRFDMAGLLLHDTFRETWGKAAGKNFPKKEPAEFWEDALATLRKAHPDVFFLAEVYGESRYRLLDLGFDFVYDKELLDDLLNGVGQETIQNLAAWGDRAFQLVHFTENHDEARAAEAFGPTRSMAAALVASALPGMMLFQEGQREGWRVKLPLQLRRRPQEKPNRRLERFYARLLAALKNEVFRSGRFQPLALHPVEDHLSVAPGLMAFLREKGEERRIVIANSGRGRGRAHAPLPAHWTASNSKTLRLIDELSGATEDLPMREVRDRGFLVDLSMGGHRLWRVHSD